MLRRALLVCGILSSLIYIVANIVAARLYAGYSVTDQTVSELSAIGAPTRPLWVMMGIIYTLLFAAFGWGVWLSAGRNRALKFAGGQPSPEWPFGSTSSFGAPGSGGSLGFADPTAGIGYAYVTSQMGTALTGDPRDVALRDALYSALPISSSLGRLAA